MCGAGSRRQCRHKHAGPSAVYPVLPAVAAAANTTYFDLRDANGDAFLPQYFGPDGAHESNDGHDAVYRRVMATIMP